MDTGHYREAVTEMTPGRRLLAVLDMGTPCGQLASLLQSGPTPSPHLILNPRTSSRDNTSDPPGTLAGLFAIVMTLDGRPGIVCGGPMQPCQHSFDHLVGAGEQHRWHDDAKRLCGLQIDHKLVLGRLFDRQVGRLRTLEDLVDESSGPTLKICRIRTVGQKEARLRVLSLERGDWQPISEGHVRNLAAIVEQHSISLHDERLRVLPHH